MRRVLRQRMSLSDGTQPAPSGPSWWLRLAGLLIFVGVVLGFIGYEQDKGDTFDDAYRAIRLVFVDMDATTVPWELQVGRWCAAIGAGLAAYRGLRYVFGSKWEHLRAGRRRDHVVVAGLGDYGGHLARAFRTSRDPSSRLDVVGIEVDPRARAVAGVRAAGGVVLVGDAGDPRQRLLEQASVARARYLVVTCGDDGVNVDVAMRAGSLVSESARTFPLTAFVHLDDLRLWPRLKARTVSTRGDRPFRMEFFNVFETGARILVETHRPFPLRAEGPVGQVVLLGLGGLGEQVLLHVAQRWQAERGDRVDRVPITVVAPEAEQRLRVLADRHPRLREVATIDAVERDIDLTSEEADRLLEQVPTSIVYVCAATDGDGVAAALSVHPAARARGVPVVAVLDEEDRGLVGALQKDGRSLPGLSVFGVVARALPPELLVRGTTEILARAKHEHYLAMERARGADEAVNPSAAPWDQLPESLRESNRAFADRIGEKLERAGCVLVPDPFAAAGGDDFVFTDDEVEELARVEHRRWYEDLWRDGWRPGRIKDPERRLHPLLVDWDELPEDEREKDREPVRALPEFVARAGFVIVRAEPPDRDLVFGGAGD